MTTKVGILSDKHHRENCLEYMNVPQGYFNAVYRGEMPNRNYPGIKSSKYQRAPLKPAHLVDYATNMARLQGGNIANNARNTINTIKPDMVNFVNKPVFPTLTTPAFPDTGGGVPTILPTIVAPSIGSVISSSSIGTTNPPEPIMIALSGVAGSGYDINFLKANFFTKNRVEQELIVKTLGNSFRAESGAYPMNYKASGQKSKAELQVDIDNILRQIEVSGTNVNVAGIIGIPTEQTLAQLGGAGPSTAIVPYQTPQVPLPPIEQALAPQQQLPPYQPPPETKIKKQISPKRVKSSSTASQASTTLASVAEVPVPDVD